MKAKKSVKKPAKKIVVQQKYVEFISPGTFFAETSSIKVDKWSVKEALDILPTIKERYGATPYAFRFFTIGRSAKDLDSKRLKTSKFYYVDAKLETYEEIVAA